MEKKNIYSKKFILTIRFIAIIALIILGVRTGVRIIHRVLHPDYYISLSSLETRFYYIIVIGNIIVSAITCFIIIYPHKFFLIGIIAFVYSLANVGQNYVFIPMFALTIATFIMRGYFTNHKKIKIVIFSILYVLVLLFPFAFDTDDYFEYLITAVAHTFIIAVCIFFFMEYMHQKSVKEISPNKVLNIADYKNLTRSDMLLLQDVLDGMKYKEIAKKINGSEGALRNKLSRIYKTLEVGDRIGFTTIYSGYSLIFEPQEEGSSNPNP